MKLTKEKLLELVQEVLYPLEVDGGIMRGTHELYKDALEHVGERVWVHTERTQRNRKFNGMIGVYKAGNSNNRVGSPYFKTNAIALKDCVFQVSGGKAIDSIQTTGKRTLVAGAVGDIVNISEEQYNPALGIPKQPFIEISFNPMVGHFYALNDPEQKRLVECALLYFTASEDGKWTMSAMGLKYETNKK